MRLAGFFKTHAVPIGIFLISISISIGICNSWYRNTLADAKEKFRYRIILDAQTSKEKIEQVFTLTYDSLRLLASLPGVQKIDHQAKSFSPEAKITAQ